MTATVAAAAATDTSFDFLLTKPVLQKFWKSFSS